MIHWRSSADGKAIIKINTKRLKAEKNVKNRQSEGGEEIQVIPVVVSTIKLKARLIKLKLIKLRRYCRRNTK